MSPTDGVYMKLLLFLLITTPLVANAKLVFKGFSEVGFNYSKTSAASSNSFFIGKIDLFMTKSLSDKVRFLGEVAFELNESNSGAVDPERLWIQYEVNPWLKIKVGRVHTALGYWNNLYHHGSYLQTTVNRPHIYEFEEDGGILPTHSTGIEFRGQGSCGDARCGYIANLANGRGPEPEPPQGIDDADHSKAVSLLVYYELENGIQFGFNIYSDHMPGGTKTTQAADSTGTVKETTTTLPQGEELILGTHFVWIADQVEFLTEYIRIQHKYNTTGDADANLDGFYGQLAYHISDYYMPYLRFEFLKTDVTDVYTNTSDDREISILGLKYELTANSSLKAEFSYTALKNGIDTQKADLNWSFGW